MRILPKATLLLAASVFLLALGSAPARAVPLNPITETFGGKITFLDESYSDPNGNFGGNNPFLNSPFGFDEFTPVSLILTYDRALVDFSGLSLLNPESDSSLRLNVNIGNFSLMESHDFGFDLFPEIKFENGLLTGVDFFATFNLPPLGADPYEVLLDSLGEFDFSIIGNTFNFIGDGVDILVAGQFNYPVPEPGTLLLLGSGLAGLAALRRKRGK